MGVYRTNCRRKISNPQIQQHQFAKMASFKILLVVALVAFIGSSDALKCMDDGDGDGDAATKDCADGDKSCNIEAKITIADKKATVKEITKQACHTKDLEGKTKVFVIPEALHDLKDGEVDLPYYCSADDCNIKKAIDDAIAENNMAATLSDPNNKGHKAEKAETNVGGGAAQTSVAVATIAFSMVMARLAL